jgi:hypothetical protein
VLLLFNFLSSLFILYIKPLLNESLGKIFSCSVICLKILLIVTFDMQNFVVSCKPVCQFFLLFGGQLESCLGLLLSSRDFLMFSVVVSKVQTLH